MPWSSVGKAGLVNHEMRGEGPGMKGHAPEPAFSVGHVRMLDGSLP